MKLQTSLFAGLALALTAIAPAEINWSSDFSNSKKAAAEKDKLMLVNFTGSDWCHWCVTLKKEVFDEKAFEAAADKYVLVELDFPQDEKIITPEQRKANEEVAQKYGVQGFPTVLLMTSKGVPVARTGYQEGGAEAYLTHLETITEPWEKLKSAEGEDRRDALVAFLRNVSGPDIEAYYPDEFAELKKLDPQDESGFIAEMELGNAMVEFEGMVEEGLSSGDFDTVLTSVDKFIETHNPEGEQLQHILMARVMVYVEQGEKEKAFTQIDEMAALAPESEMAANLEEIKESISSHLEMRAKMEAEAQQEPAEVEAPEPAEDAEPSVMEKAADAEKVEEKVDAKPAKKE